jgi:hypothetical protein
MGSVAGLILKDNANEERKQGFERLTSHVTSPYIEPLHTNAGILSTLLLSSGFRQRGKKRFERRENAGKINQPISGPARSGAGFNWRKQFTQAQRTSANHRSAPWG